MSVLFRAAEAKMDRLVDDCSVSYGVDGAARQTLSLKSFFAGSTDMRLMREIDDGGVSGPVTIDADITQYNGRYRHNVAYVEQEGDVVPISDRHDPPGLLRKANLIARVVLSRPGD